MQVVQTIQDLQHDVLGLSLGQSFHLLQVGVQIPIGAILQSKDNVMFGLECIEKVDQILVLYAEENVLLVLKHLHLFCCCYRVLTDEL